ncbi:hypothetical protein ACVWYH_000626 [Bradyrhizobium sp. GM24.11]
MAASASKGSPSWNFTAGPELDDEALAVVEGLARQRELGHDVELLVDVEQLVAERGKHDAADIGARHRGIEDIGVLGETDAQRGLRVGGSKRQQERSRGCGEAKHLHRTVPIAPANSL